MDSQTPVALVERASRPEQRVVTGTLSTITEVAAEAEIEPPAITVIGGVVGERETLATRS